MIKLALDAEQVLADLRLWRDAALMTRRRHPPRAGEARTPAANLSATAERVDGYLMLLQSCSAASADAHDFEQLVAQLHEYKEWIAQAQYASQLLQTLSPPPTRKRAPAHSVR